MGWFSSKKKVYVSSSTWNLLGDQDPIDHIQYSLLESKLMEDKRDTAEVINDSLLTGPAVTFRHFMRWAKQSQYNDLISLATSVYYDSPMVSRAEMAELLKKYLNISNSIYVKDIYLGYYDYMYYGKQWIYQNKPEDLLGNYKVELISVKDHQDYYWDQEYHEGHGEDGGYWESVKVYYWVYREDIKVTLVDGSTHVIDSRPYNNKTKRLYSEYEITTKKVTIIPGKPQDSSKPEGPDNPLLPPTEQIEYVKSIGILIYAQGDGYAPFDALFSSSIPMYNSYAPFIPLRTWNQFISNGDKKYLPEIYKPAKNATKKALGADKYDELIKEAANNQQIGDIDFIYLSFGCPLNSPYQEGRKYIYQFFYNLFMGIESRPKTRGFFGSIIGQYRNTPRSVQIKSNSSAINYNIWLEWGGLKISTGSGLCRPYAKPGKYYFWASLTEEHYSETYTHIGHGEDGDYDEYRSWDDDYEHVHLCFQRSAQEYTEITITNLCQANLIYGGKSVTISAGDALGFQEKHSYSYYRHDDNSPVGSTPGWELIGESHQDLTAISDPQTPDKDLSGFIVPIQYNTIMDMGLRRANDLIQECNNLIFNCYVVKKVKWYQRGAFKIILSIVIVVIVVICYVYGNAAGGSIATKLGGTIGGSIAGITAGAATVTFLQAFVAIAINAMVSLVVSTLIMKAATMLLGDKLGLIVGTVVSMVASFGINNYGTIVESGWSTALAETDKLLFIGSSAMSVVNSYTGLLGIKTAGIYASMQTLQEKFKNKMEEIEDLMKKISPKYILTYLFNSAILEENKRIPYETSDMFLSRTLMVGSDIRDLNLAGIHDMTSITLEPQLT